MKKEEIECNHCKKDNKRRVVIKRTELEKIELNNPDYPDFVEYLCNNLIKTKKRTIGAEWIERKCQNRLLVRKIKVE